MHDGLARGRRVRWGLTPSALVRMMLRMTVTIEGILARIEVERIAGMHVLADWWLAQFGDPSHDPSNPTESGEAFVFRSVMSAEAKARNACPPITTELRAKFRAGIIRHAQPDGDALWDKTIGTDYGPGLVLGPTMEECGIPKIRAPWKTMSWAYGGGLVIRIAIGHYRDVERAIYVAPVVEALAAMSDDEIDAIPDPRRHLQLRWMVKMAGEIALTDALERRATDCDAMAYVLDAIRRGRAAVEAGR